MADERTLMDRLIEGLKNLAELEIVTVIGTATVDGKLEGGNTKDDVMSVRFAQSNEREVFFSRLNIADGDIVTVVPAAHIAEDSAARKLHFEQVRTSREIVAGNLEFISRVLREFGARLPESETKPSG